MQLRTALIGILLIGMVVPAASPAASATSYDITITNSIDIPMRTATIEGSEYQVSAVAQRSPGDTLDVAVAASDTESTYRIYLYNEQGDIVQDSSAKSGDGETNFDTSNLDPGSYYAAVYQGGVQKIHPVVIAGYEVATSAPNSVEQGDSATVTVDVTQTEADRAPPLVQIVLGDTSEALRVNATETSSGTYEATVSTDDIDTGTYSLYGVVRGTETTNDGRRIVLGLSESHTLEVTDQSTTETPDSSDGTNGGSDTNGGSSDGPSDNPTAAATQTATDSLSQTATSTAVTTGPPTTTEPTTATATVINPNQTETITITSTTTSQPGLGVIMGLVALTLFGVLVIRHL